ncbi:cytochrome c family protein [Ahrensia sp. R2A130]|uniref:c-type cytochrome n=1 Tax=Ahrensia sp. R2A130 TaxID=744979 RepID=UPI0001E0E087|nr:cytochrome c family protein [Ahrensia sp. R2A130]EFL89829.1 cytochrome c, class I [Ahrensia sp. R2A130]
MDSFEWNKVFGAFLAVAFVALGLTFLSDGLYHADTPEVAGFEIEGGVQETVAAAAPTAEPVMPMLASMSPADGEGVAKKCVACHNFEKGSANKVGPQLWDIVNRDIAGVEGFGYSGALKEYGEGKQWTYEELNGFLWKPKSHVKGTSMGFAGIKKVEERAELIAYLRTLSDSPAEMPAAGEAATPAAAEGVTPATDAEAPATEGEAPATDAEAPAAEGETPATDAEAPAAEGETPATDAETPAAEGETTETAPAGDADNVDPAEPNVVPTPEAGEPVIPGATGTPEGVVPEQPLGGATETAPAPATSN